jgi:preprotein translocase subunit SecE
MQTIIAFILVFAFLAAFSATYVLLDKAMNNYRKRKLKRFLINRI